MTAATFDCRFCIDGHMPAGRDESMGELFETCTECRIPCGDCDGMAVYPANNKTPTELVVDLLRLCLAPVFCPGCFGVITVIPLHRPGGLL